MIASELKTLQAPLKEKYKQEPASALVTLRATGRAAEGVACSVETGRALVKAGLHPASGGDGTFACSGDMLLQALVACAGVTLRALRRPSGLTFRMLTSPRRGTWTSGEHSASQRRLLLVSGTFGSASISQGG